MCAFTTGRGDYGKIACIRLARIYTVFKFLTYSGIEMLYMA